MKKKSQKKIFNYKDYLGPHLLIFLAAISVIFFAAYLSFRQDNEIVVTPASVGGSPSLPGATVLTYQDKDVALIDLLPSDKTLVVFWATWCGPCVEEIKRMPQLLPQIKQKGYAPLFINYDQFENRKAAQSFAQQSGIVTAYDVQGDILSALGISALPISLIVNKSGKVLKILYGELDISKL